MIGPVLVLDAANGIGAGLIQAVIDAGRPVIAVSRDASRLNELQARHPHADLTAVLGSVDDEVSGQALAEDLRALGRPITGMLVSRCTEQARGRVLDQSSQALLDKLQADLMPHLVAARVLLPVLAESGRNGHYIVIGGPGSENPWAGYGHRSICAAATTMLLRVLHDEARALSVRVQMLSVDSPVRTADNASCACEQWPSAIALGMQALALLDQTDATKSVQAVVKVTGAVTAPRPVARIAHAPTPVPAPLPEPQVTHMPNDVAPLVDDPTSKDPQQTLDDTWALLRPFLSAARDGRRAR